MADFFSFFSDIALLSYTIFLKFPSQLLCYNKHMKIIYDQNPPINIRNLLLKIGYHEHYDRKMKRSSYVSPLGSAYYPRFHIYAQEKNDGSIELDLHLDQKKASYKGQKAHMGESDSSTVLEEGARIQRWLDYMKMK